MTHWLLDLTVDGHLYRLAEVDLDVTRDDGSVLHYSADLEVDPVTESTSLLSASATQPEAQVRVWLPVSSLALLRGRGELSRWTEGTTYERRRRVLAGACQSPETESPEEGITTTIAQDAWRDSAMLIAPTQAITPANWSHTGQIASLTDGDQSIPYPIIIGRPGRLPSSGATGDEVQIPAMVAPWLWHGTTTGVDADAWTGYVEVALMLAGHHISATKVWLTTETDTVGSWFHVANVWDDAGQPCAVVPFWYSWVGSPPDIYAASGAYHFASNATPTLSFANDTFGLGHPDLPPAYNTDTNQPAIYASFPIYRSGISNGDAEGTGGLTVDGSSIRAAGDVLAWALSRTGAGVDRLAMAAAVEALRPYQIDAVIASQPDSGPWAWVSQTLLPILPCSLASGPDGIYVVPVRLDMTAADAVARLDSRRADVEARALSWDTTQLARSVTVKSRYNVKTGVYTASVTYATSSAVAAAPTSTTILPHPSLDLAAAWGLTGADLVIETAAVYDTPTAYLIAYTQAQIRGLPVGHVVYDVPEDDALFSSLRRGAPVYCYDADLGIDGMGQVEEITTASDGSLLIGVMLIIDPTRGALR